MGLIWAVLSSLMSLYIENLTEKEPSAFFNNFLFALNYHQFAAGTLTAIGLASRSQSFESSCHSLMSLMKPLMNWLWTLSAMALLLGFFEWDITKISLGSLLIGLFLTAWLALAIKLFQNIQKTPDPISIRLSTI